MAYMSDAGGPQAGDASDIRLDAFDADKGASTFEYYPQWCSRVALREAERILAETERETILFHGSQRTFYSAVSESVVSHGGAHQEARADLAAALAAILPVLGELAADATQHAARVPVPHMRRETTAHNVYGMFARNAATLAAMDAGK